VLTPYHSSNLLLLLLFPDFHLFLLLFVFSTTNQVYSFSFMCFLSLYCYCQNHFTLYFILLNSFFLFFSSCCPYNISHIYPLSACMMIIICSLFLNVVIRLHTSCCFFFFSCMRVVMFCCWLVFFFCKRDPLYNFKKKKNRNT
jgi:hypothetical protein